MARVKLHLLQVAVAVALLGLWELAAKAGWVSELFVSDPITVAKTTWDLLGDGSTYGDLWVTTREILIGMVIGVAAGVTCGILLGLKPYAYRVVSPIIGTLYTLPRLALLPLFVLWFGLGQGSKIALVVSLVFFSMLLNTYSGVREIDPRLRDAVRLMGGGRGAVVKEVLIPATLPWILAGLRVSLVFAVTGAVIGEMMAGQSGLGYLITARGQLFDTKGLLALLVIVAALAIVLNALITMAENRLTFWKKSQTRDVIRRRRRTGREPVVAGLDLSAPDPAETLAAAESTVDGRVRGGAR
jgi:NitT/TauT family transport system permease protein